MKNNNVMTLGFQWTRCVFFQNKPLKRQIVEKMPNEEKMVKHLKRKDQIGSITASANFLKKPASHQYHIFSPKLEIKEALISE